MLRIVLSALILFSATAAFSQVTGFAIESDGDANLYSIDLLTGTATQIGLVGFSDVEGLAFSPDGVLYGASDTKNELIIVDWTTGAATLVGPFGVAVDGLGLTFDCDGDLWMTSRSDDELYSVDPQTGAATLVGQFGTVDSISGLAYGPDRLIGVGDVLDLLWDIDPSTAEAQAVGGLGIDVDSNQGLDFDASGTLWGLSDNGGQIYTVDPQTGIATAGAVTTVTQAENLAIGPPPFCPAPIVAVPTLGTLGVVALGLLLGVCGAGLLRRRFRSV